MSTFTLPIEDLSKAELQSELANLIKVKWFYFMGPLYFAFSDLLGHIGLRPWT